MLIWVRDCALTIFELFFFFNDTATTEIYTLSLHDALPISRHWCAALDTEARHNIATFHTHRMIATDGDWIRNGDKAGSKYAIFAKFCRNLEISSKGPGFLSTFARQYGRQHSPRFAQFDRVFKFSRLFSAFFLGRFLADG